MLEGLSASASESVSRPKRLSSLLYTESGPRAIDCTRERLLWGLKMEALQIGMPGHLPHMLAGSSYLDRSVEFARLWKVWFMTGGKNRDRQRQRRGKIARLLDMLPKVPDFGIESLAWLYQGTRFPGYGISRTECLLLPSPCDAYGEASPCKLSALCGVYAASVSPAGTMISDSALKSILSRRSNRFFTVRLADSSTRCRGSPAVTCCSCKYAAPMSRTFFTKLNPLASCTSSGVCSRTSRASLDRSKVSTIRQTNKVSAAVVLGECN